MLLPTRQKKKSGTDCPRFLENTFDGVVKRPISRVAAGSRNRSPVQQTFDVAISSGTTNALHVDQT